MVLFCSLEGINYPLDHSVSAGYQDSFACDGSFASRLNILATRRSPQCSFFPPQHHGVITNNFKNPQTRTSKFWVGSRIDTNNFEGKG